MYKKGGDFVFSFFVYWIIVSILGNDILQYKVFGIDTFIIFLFIGIMESMFFVIKNIKTIEKLQTKSVFKASCITRVINKMIF